jgi:tight adherence protein B
MSNPAVLIALVFVATLGLLLSAGYFLIAAPLARHKLRTRVTVPMPSVATKDNVTAEIMRRATLSDIPALSRVLAQIQLVAKLEFFLRQAAVRIQVATFVMIVAAAAVGTWMMVQLSHMGLGIALIFTVIAGAMPFMVVAYKRQLRFRKFQEQFPDAIDLLARAVRAGHAFTTAFSLIGSEMSDPIAEEFRATYQQQNLGLPLRDAFINLTVRVPLADVRIFVTALQIHRESGGNLGEILDNLSSVIRERFKILREIQTVTAEARLSMYALMVMPLCAGVLLYLANPTYLMPLFEDALGFQMVLAAGVMQLVGYLIIRRIVRIKV